MLPGGNILLTAEYITRTRITMEGGEITGRDPGDQSWRQCLTNRRVYVRTFGCTYNEGDSALLKTILTGQDCLITEDPDDADVIILNTCIVIDRTERNMLRMLRIHAGKERWVTGCLPLARPDLLDEFPDVRVIHPDAIHEAAEDEVPCSGPVQVVQVGPGCAGSCRYCLTRVARGFIRSIPEDDICRSIQQASASGAVEIRLSGQDLSSYGRDTDSFSLGTLLGKVPALPGNCRIRLGMMNPGTLLPIAQETARAMKEGSFFSFLHLPVQSGSDRILESMGRGYTVRDVLEIARIFRHEIPGITIVTDFITGFPGETEEDHDLSMQLLRDLAPGMINVTRYSWRPGSLMGREDELPDRIRKDRSREMIREGYAYLLKNNEKMGGEQASVLVTEHLRNGSVMARTGSYRGVVIQREIKPGSLLNVKITGCTPHYLIGRPEDH
ncbi:MAG: radical SAM protein [Methanospirillum sp.]|nr:radical SAM protein [Methanospirillum sp.]